MNMDGFHPLIHQWFAGRFGGPTEPQRRGWPSIAAGQHTLIAAPTGSGKTLAAFLVCIDRLFRDWLAGRLERGVQVVYVSPLKALSNDVEHNLREPLAEIADLAFAAGWGYPPLVTGVRTGDTPNAERQATLRRPPHILVTTPESLYLLLTSVRGREILRPVKTVIVDEIHALARDKRGSHLSLSLERLVSLADRSPTRIGLSATQRPIDEIARFLVGSRCDEVRFVGDPPDPTAADGGDELAPVATANPDGTRGPVFVVDAGHVRQLDLAINTPLSELSAVCSHAQWAEVYARLVEQIDAHRSTLVFVNTRRLAERVSHKLRELLGDESVAGHHGSLSREIRLDAERRLKDGSLKAIVATASLEMGIDVGYIDLVCQIGSPRGISTFLQRVGRSGHSLGAVPKGRLFPLTRDELLESMALVRAVGRCRLDEIEIPAAPLDILAQQIVAAVSVEEWDERELLRLVRRSHSFRDLSDADFEAVLTMLSQGLTPTTRRGAWLHRDRIGGKLRPRSGARLAALTSGGAIPETAEYRVMVQPEEIFVGKLDEDFAIESSAGDIFLLGNTSWRVQYVRSGEVAVSDAQGAPPNVPFWFGEAPGRTIELSGEISELRSELERRLAVDSTPQVLDWLQAECGADSSAAIQAADYVRAQTAAIGLVPTGTRIVFERFFDESGGMQLVIHAPLGTRINRAWGLALRKRFCRSFDFELQAAATDDGIVLSIGPQHSFPIDALFKMLTPQNATALLEQAVLAAPMFQVRWRWNVTRALAVLRFHGGKKVQPHLQRFRSDDLLAAAFPETVGCLENHHGDVEIPDHPLVRQTMHDCLTEAMDLPRWIGLLEDVQAGRVELIARDTREPSPFCYELLNANPYALLDDAPLEERRTRAVATRRSFSSDDVRDLARLDGSAIAQVRREAWPLVRNADELHDALLSLALVGEHECRPWSQWFSELTAAGRAARVSTGDRHYWIAAESWPLARALFPDATAEPPVSLPSSLDGENSSAEAIVAVVRGRLQHCGPVTACSLADLLGIGESAVFAALEALEGRGLVLRGQFTTGRASGSTADAGDVPTFAEWCDRRLLARIHRLTMDGLRQRVQPVNPQQFMCFLLRRHRAMGVSQWTGVQGVRTVLSMLQGFEAAAGAWERGLIGLRVARYQPQWLDQLFLSGEVAWGRLRVPRRDDTQRSAAISRIVPVSMMLRSDLGWLVATRRNSEQPAVSDEARAVLAALEAGGALFLQDLAAVSDLPPESLEAAIRELAGWGLITSDAFAAIRALVGGRNGVRRRRSAVRGGMAAPAGRWSRFPATNAPAQPDERTLEHWCRQLLRRYGVVCRNVLKREAAAPTWRDLLPALRRMELRGEIRGGRFIAEIAGEQFAEEASVAQLRAERELARGNEWVVVSAADPLNLSGIIDPGPRVPATHKNALVWSGGRCVAARLRGRIEFFEQVEPQLATEMEQALAGRRPRPTPTADGPLPPAGRRAEIRNSWLEAEPQT